VPYVTEDPYVEGAREDHSVRRTVRSFVRREGRMTDGQVRAIDAHLKDFAIPAQGILNFNEIFRRSAPTCLEIGSGNGECVARLAARAPDINYLAVEVHRPGVGHLLKLAVDTTLHNLRVSTEDVQGLLPRLVPESLAAVYIFFPDPWPKLRHRKRRLLQADFFAALRPALQRHGRLYFATDIDDYAEEVRTLIDASGDWVNLAGGSESPRLKARLLTRFESRGLAAGRGVHDFTFGRLR
jgi:tRNA (guanine-N7-)-methyltransferase